jgi:DNA-binding response OmpR family regulator
MTILIIDDQCECYADFILNIQNQRPDVEILQVPSALEARLKYITTKPGLIILDQSMGGGDRDGTAFLRGLSEQPGDTPDIIFVTQYYNQLPIPEILNSNIPITLFLEKNSPSFHDSLLIAVQLVMRRVESQVCYAPKELFGDLFLKQILEESTAIIRKRNSGYISLDQQQQIGTLIRSYINSLEMRSKWDSDDVIELSIFLAQSLCGVFEIPADMVDVLRRFLNLEDVLYTIPHYRNHFFHQIKVFLLGFCIINTLNSHGRLRNTILEGSNGMKLWFLTSVFHDIGYPFEKMARWLNTFIEGTLRSPGDKDGVCPLLPIEFNWGALLGKRFHAYHLELLAKNVCNLYGINEPQAMAEILTKFTSFVVEKPDHGLYSSLILQNFLRYKLDDKEVDPVSLAIALHNDEVASVITGVIGPQTFEKNPLSFLLAFCDLAQDWGRIRPSGIDKSGYGRFGYPGYASERLFDPATNTVCVILRYERNFTLFEVQDWVKDIYDKYIAPARAHWAISTNGQHELKFCIEYQTSSKVEPRLRQLNF